MIILTGAIALGGTASAFIFWGQLGVLQAQLDQMAADQRPWIHADLSIEEPVTLDTNGMNFSLRFIVKNNGRTPAIFVWNYLQPFLGEDDAQTPLQHQKKLCLSLRKTIGPTADGFTLFPDQTVELRHHLTIAPAAFATDRSGASFVNIVGCTDYQTTGAKTHHQTGFIYRLVQTNLSDRDRLWSIGLDDGAMPVGKFRLEPSLDGGAFYAD